MLKLEKTGDLSNITIRMREKEGFFEPILIKALGIALMIHCGALVLFHVTPFSFTSTFTFPPVHVQSNISFTGVSALASYAEDEYEIPPPPLSFVPPLNWVAFSEESSLVPKVSFDADALESLEKKIWPRWEEPLHIQLEEPRIQLAISGDLAELPLIESDPLLSQMQPLSPHNHAVYVVYNVQLDERTGEIFWFDCLESSGVSKIDRLAEKIILNLRFGLPEEQAPVLGIISFVFLDTLLQDTI